MSKLLGFIRSTGVLYVAVGMVLLAGAFAGLWELTDLAKAEAQSLAEDVEVRSGAVWGGYSGQYIVVFEEAALAGYDGGIPGYSKPGNLPGKARLNVRSTRALNYVNFLKQRQAEYESSISISLGRPIQVSVRMQHAINALALSLAPEEVEAIAKLPGVRFIEPVRDLPLDTEVGPQFIGATDLWNGIGPALGNPVQGEGTVIGVLDTGINFGSPSFSAVDPIDGYAHANPLGAGNYLGTCAAGGPDEGRCNSKLIGGYDFVCAFPGVNACSNAGLREEPGFGDTDGHGTHVASTSAGNRRDLSLGTLQQQRISGVAPRANIIAYDVCYTIQSSNNGSCPSISTTAAVNQAVADGVVDTINYSISGGTLPWNEATSMAFLGATNAGIYVATSAGNDGPGANTMGHLEPWTSSTAAAQHGRAGFALGVSVTGPGSVPANLTNLIVTEGTGGVAPLSTVINAPLVASPIYTSADDGCSAFGANTFSGAIALVRRGTCTFAIKVNNAAAAGAVAVVIGNNAAGVITPNVPGVTIPVFGVTQADGLALNAWAVENPTATASIGGERITLSNTPDQLASFSSRGPAGNFDLVKPDVTAPGVAILAAYAGTTLTGSENITTAISGTSMASPHNAGSSLLLRQLRPDWTVAEIKSALQMTAKRSVLKEDGTTPATAFDMGAGRIRVDVAADAGLLLNEVYANYLNANPAEDGNPGALNLPSMSKRSCVAQCQFTRTFRSPLPVSRTWNAAITGLTGTVTPSTFTVPPNGSVTLTITIDSSLVPPNGSNNFGWLEITPQSTPGAPTLTLPVSISVPPATISLSPASQTVTLAQGASGSASFAVHNSPGSFPLSFSVDQTGQGSTTAYKATSTGVSSGFRNTIYNDPATAGSQAQFAADDFDLTMATKITSLFAEGFVVSNQTLASVVTNITWSIYPDAAGSPAGNPQSNPGAAIWTYTAAPTAAGVSTPNNSNILLDLVPAGQNVTLPPGKYWLVVNTRSTFANRWALYGSNTGSGGFKSITVSSGGSGAWLLNNSFAGLSMEVRGTVPCGAAWIGSSTSSSGTVAGGASQLITSQLNATGLAVGSFYGSVCLASNDLSTPKIAELIKLDVTLNNAAGVRVSGRVLTPEGFGLRNAQVMITDAWGAARTVITSTAGYYQFDDIGPGREYRVSVASKRFRFAARTVNVTGSLADIDFIAQE